MAQNNAPQSKATHCALPTNISGWICIAAMNIFFIAFAFAKIKFVDYLSLVMSSVANCLSPGAVLVLQTAYAACEPEPRVPTEVFQTLGMTHEMEAAVRELRIAALLATDDDEDAVDSTEAGWAAIAKAWPTGQLVASASWKPSIVIGSFDDNDDLPTRFPYQIPRSRSVLMPGTRFAREARDQKLLHTAWQLYFPPTGEPESRILVRIDEGHGEVVESFGGSQDRDGVVSVGPRTWLSIDDEGRCCESRQSLEELIFLIAMEAA